jgi:beta-lactamase class A
VRRIAALLCAVSLLGVSPLSETQRLQAVVTAVAAHAKTALGARFGIAVWDVKTGARAGAYAAQGFPLASAFKLPLAMTVLERVDAGTLALDQRVTILPQDIITYASSVADDYANGARTFTLEDLVTRMVRDSDNTAADTLYRIIGGATAINAALAKAGVHGISIRTDEAGLHRDFVAERSYARGGDNSATPDAYAALLNELVVFTDPRTGPLAPSSADLLFEIMSDSQTGVHRLRAGLPPNTRLAHKTGTSGRYPSGAVDATNDGGVAFLLGGARPVIVVAFLNGAHGSDAQNDAAIAALARAVEQAVR